MQKLVWQNSKGDKINLTSGHYGITHWEGFSGVDLNIQSQQVPFQDGSVFLDALLSERELTVTIAINDNNNLELRYQLRRELIHNLNPKLGEGYLIYTNDFISKRIKCIANPPIFENHNSNDSGTPKASLTWTACNPYWEDLEDEEISLTGFEQVDLDYDGDADTEPEIILTGTAVNPVIRNINNLSDVRLKGEIKDSIMNLAPGKKSFNAQNLGFYLNGDSRSDFAESNDIQIIIGSTISYTDNLKDFKVALISNENDRFYCCAYGKGLFLVGGHNLRKSVNGSDWELISNKPEGDINAIFYDEIDDLFYMEINKKLYSTSDLLSFTQLATLPLQANQIIRHKNAIYIVTAVVSGTGNYGCFKYENSTLTTLNTGATRNINAIASDGDNLIIGGDGFTLKYSQDDGTTWTSITVSENINGICYNQSTSQFVFCGVNGLLGYGTLNNITWTNIGEYPRYGCAVSKLFGVVEITGRDLVFFKNSSFTKSNNIPMDLYCCVYFKNKYIAGGSAGHLYISEDFENWELKSIDVDADIEKAECNENEAYFITKKGDIIYTKDAINFSITYSNPTGRFSEVFRKNDYYYGLDSSKKCFFKSSDKKRWTQLSSFSFNANNYCFVNNKIIINDSYSGEHYYISDDFENWSELTSLQDMIIESSVIVYYNGYYVFSNNTGEASNIIYKTPDFENLTPIHPELSNAYLIAPSVVNNNLFILSTSYQEEPFEMIGAIYRSDLTNLTNLKTFSNSYFLKVEYYDGKYYIAGVVYDENLGSVTGNYETSDFENFIFNERVIPTVQNNKLYEMVYDNDNEFYGIRYNGEMIYVGDIGSICYDLLIIEPIRNNYNFWQIVEIPSMTPQTIPTNEDNFISSCWDGINLYLLVDISTGSSTFCYKISNNIFSEFKYFSGSQGDVYNRATVGVSNYGDYIYFLTNKYYVDGSYVRYINIFDKEGNFIESKTIALDYSTSYYIENGILLSSENKLVWFEKDEDYNIDRVCVFDLITNELKLENKSIEIYDGIYRNNVFYAIGYGGIMYAPNGEYWQFISNSAFIFRYFVRNKYYYFVGIWGIIGFLEYVLGENIIEKVESFSFRLTPGENKLVLTYDSGEMIASIKYRRKYIGV